MKTALLIHHAVMMTVICMYSVIIVSAGVLDFFRASDEEWITEPNLVRGVPEYQHSSYLQESFTCDAGSRTISKAEINDGYCDCNDKSDEPGTSACADNTFKCINKGYKIISIPSSRVDDQICDCCDGSDEGILKECPNTCYQAAMSEKADLEKKQQHYLAGSKVRLSMIAQQAERLKTTEEKVKPMENEIKSLKTEVESVSRGAFHSEKKARNSKITYIDKAHTDFRKLLFLQDCSLEDAAKILSSFYSFVDSGDSNTNIEVPPVDEENSQIDEDEYDEYQESPTEAVQSDENIESATLSTGTDEPKEDSCLIVKISEDNRLHQYCQYLPPNPNELDNHALVTTVLYDLIYEHNLYKQIAYLMGYFWLNGHMDGSHNFVKKYVTEPEFAMTCPSEFSSLQEKHKVCSIHEALSTMMNNMKSVFENLDKDGITLRTKQEELLKKIQEIEKDKENAVQITKDLNAKRNENTLDFDSLLGQCHDKVDGKFTYTVCWMDKATQRETSGGASTSLGIFERLSKEEEFVDADAPTYVMHFHQGQHCWGLNVPRRAAANIYCGSTTKLLSATEPSTCFYTFDIESPVACTEKYARLNGIGKA